MSAAAKVGKGSWSIQGRVDGDVVRLVRVHTVGTEVTEEVLQESVVEKSVGEGGLLSGTADKARDVFERAVARALAGGKNQ
jgi:hypothetical protein